MWLQHHHSRRRLRFQSLLSCFRLPPCTFFRAAGWMEACNYKRQSWWKTSPLTEYWLPVGNGCCRWCERGFGLGVWVCVWVHASHNTKTFLQWMGRPQLFDMSPSLRSRCLQQTAKKKYKLRKNCNSLYKIARYPLTKFVWGSITSLQYWRKLKIHVMSNWIGSREQNTYRIIFKTVFEYYARKSLYV